MRLSCSRSLLTALLITTPCATARAQAPAASACDVLTSSDVEAAAGFKPSAAPKAEAHGSTNTCTYTGNALKHEVVVVVISKPAPKVTSSAAFAERRLEQGKRNPELGIVAKPVEGLGVPAIRSDDGSGPATIEAVTAGRVLGVTAPTVEAAEALAKKAIPKVR
jgi:hypothetical protein